MASRPVDAVRTPKAEIDWNRSTPWWPLLSHAAVLGMRTTNLLACAIGVYLTVLGGSITESLFDVQVRPAVFQQSGEAQSINRFDNLFQLGHNNPAAIPVMTEYSGISGVKLIGFSEFARVLVQPAEPVWDVIGSRSLTEFAGNLFRLLWNIVVWSVIGGVILRRSLIEMGTRSGCGWQDALRFLLKRWVAMLWAVGTPLIFCLSFAIAPFVLGLISRMGEWTEWGIVVLAIPVSLLMIALGWFALIGTLGLPLSWSAIMAEKDADAFDGFNRSWGYLMQKPFTAAMCFVAVIVCGLIAYVLTSLALAIAIQGGSSAYGLGSGVPLDSSDGYQIANRILTQLALAVPINMFWVGSAATYLVLRREVDFAEYDELDYEPALPIEPVRPPNAPQDDGDSSESTEGSASGSASEESAT